LGKKGTGIVGGGGLACIDGPESWIDEWWELDLDTWGARGGGAYSYGGAGWVMNVRLGAGGGAVTLERGRVELRMGGGGGGWGE
jgi:hypothetical protein